MDPIDLREGWKENSVEELCEKPQYGYTESATHLPVGPKFLRITDIQDGKVDWSKVPYCECDDVEKYRLKSGDIVFARTGATTGKSFLIVDPPLAIFASYLIRLRVRPSILPEYLYYYFQSPAYWDDVSMGIEDGNRPTMNGSKLSKLQVLYPESKDEQHRLVVRIEELTRRVGEARRLRRETLNEIDIASKTMSKKFFDLNDLNENGVALAELTTRITKGESPRWQGFQYQNHGPTFVRSENVLWGRLDLSKRTHIPKEFHRKLKRSQLKAGDVLVNLVGASIGRACIVPDGIGEANVNQAVAVVSTNPQLLLNRYLLHFLLSTAGQHIIHGGEVQSAQPNISLIDVASFKVPLPSLDEQMSIVDHLSSFQSRLDDLRGLQSETEAELGTFTCALFAKAFRGEL